METENKICIPNRLYYKKSNQTNYKVQIYNRTEIVYFKNLKLSLNCNAKRINDFPVSAEIKYLIKPYNN